MLALLLFPVLFAVMLVLFIFYCRKKLTFSEPGLVYPAIVLLPFWIFYCNYVFFSMFSVLNSTLLIVLTFLAEGFVWFVFAVLFIRVCFPKRGTFQGYDISGQKAAYLKNLNSYSLTMLVLIQLPALVMFLYLMVDLFIVMGSALSSLYEGAGSLYALIIGMLVFIPLVLIFLGPFLLVAAIGMGVFLFSITASVLGCLLITMVVAVVAAVRSAKELRKNRFAAALLALIPIANLVFQIKYIKALKKGYVNVH